MKASAECVAAIKQFEGLRLEAYKCAAGVATIGYGHTKGVKMGQKISQNVANVYLSEDIANAENQLARLVKVELTQGQWDALTDFVFNLGASNLASSTLLKYVNAMRSSAAILGQLRKWVYATVGGKKVKLAGLVKRREWEAERWTR